MEPSANQPPAFAPDLATRTALGATWLIAWRMVSRALGLLSTLVLARLLVPADFGLIAMASTFAAAVEQMLQLGLQDALVRRRGAAAELFDVAFTLQVLRAVVTAALLALAVPAATRWFAEPRLAPVLYVLAFGSVISGVENIATVEFRRAMRFGVQFTMLSVPRLLQVALTVPLALWLQSYWALLAGIVIGKLARTAMTYVVRPYRPRLRLAGWRELAGFSFWTWATTLAAVVWDRCDPFVLGPPLGPAALGVYLLASELATLPMTELIVPAAEALFAGFASAQQSGASSVRLAPIVALSLMVGVLPIVIAISAAGGFVVTALLGPGWGSAQPLVAIMAWSCLFSPFSWVASVTLVANGMVRTNFVANLLASAIKLAALVIATGATHRLDVLAAIAAGVVAVESVLFFGLMARSSGVRPDRGFAGSLLRAAIAAAAACAALYFSGLGWRTVETGSIAAACVAGVIGLIASALFAAVLGMSWIIAGRPDGPERRYVALIAPKWVLARNTFKRSVLFFSPAFGRERKPAQRGGEGV